MRIRVHLSDRPPRPEEVLVENEDNLEWLVGEETMSISQTGDQLQYRVKGRAVDHPTTCIKFPS